ncbi:MAG: dTMP kinase [Acidobacteria bacterium]|nr:dTMP kinase [Acidobacteriota bacterium]
MKSPGQFITLEGLDGCGKSTQLEMLGEYLRDQGRAVITTREPGGTKVGQQIRELLLNVSPETITALTELSLMFAARSQHIEQVILPALGRSELVLCDRFTDSSIAYQGYGRGVPLETIQTLEKLLCQGVRPDLTLILDIDAATSIQRAGVRNRKAHQSNTRFEQEGQQFFERVREGYLAIARQEPQRVRIINGSGTIEQLFVAVCSAVDKFLGISPHGGGNPAGGGRGV